jgi:hypothetical protein
MVVIWRFFFMRCFIRSGIVFIGSPFLRSCNSSGDDANDIFLTHDVNYKQKRPVFS